MNAIVPYISPEVRELHAKMAHIQNLSDAIRRAKEVINDSPSHENAAALQSLLSRRKELSLTLPRLRLV